MQISLRFQTPVYKAWYIATVMCEIMEKNPKLKEIFDRTILKVSRDDNNEIQIDDVYLDPVPDNAKPGAAQAGVVGPLREDGPAVDA